MRGTDPQHPRLMFEHFPFAEEIVEERKKSLAHVGLFSERQSKADGLGIRFTKVLRVVYELEGAISFTQHAGKSVVEVDIGRGYGPVRFHLDCDEIRALCLRIGGAAVYTGCEDAELGLGV